MIANTLAVATLATTLIFLLAGLAVAAAIFCCITAVLACIGMYEAWRNL